MKPSATRTCKGFARDPAEISAEPSANLSPTRLNLPAGGKTRVLQIQWGTARMLRLNELIKTQALFFFLIHKNLFSILLQFHKLVNYFKTQTSDRHRRRTSRWKIKFPWGKECSKVLSVMELKYVIFVVAESLFKRRWIVH